MYQEVVVCCVFVLFLFFVASITGQMPKCWRIVSITAKLLCAMYLCTKPAVHFNTSKHIAAFSMRMLRHRWVWLCGFQLLLLRHLLQCFCGVVTFPQCFDVYRPFCWQFHFSPQIFQKLRSEAFANQEICVLLTGYQSA